jgi:hypothetical protein
MTRGLRCLLHGNVAAAFLFNPLLILAFFGMALYLVYSVVVTIARLPRLRVEPIPEKTAFLIRIGVVVLIAANWTYLIVRERIFN